jgi:hypothetical protein
MTFPATRSMSHNCRLTGRAECRDPCLGRPLASMAETECQQSLCGIERQKIRERTSAARRPFGRLLSMLASELSKR